MTWRMRILTNLLSRTAREERGVALVLALLVVAALSISTAATVTLMTSNEKAFGRDRQEALAFNTAEAGLNYGLSALAQTVDPVGAAPSGAAAWYPSGYQSSGTTETFSDSSGAGEWWANKLDATTWRVYARGTSPTGAVKRTVTFKVKSATQPGATIPASQAWSKGLFVANPGSSCFTPTGSASLTISIYVKGCINLSGNVGIEEPATSTGPSVDVYAETTIAFGSGAASIGTSSKPVRSVIAPNGCTGKKGKICSQPGSNVYATIYTGPSPNLTKPLVEADSHYVQGVWNSPVCSKGSFTFDNDNVRNKSLGTVDLFPGSAYDCVVRNSLGAQVGRLAWTPATKSLVVEGLIYIDGDVHMNSNTAAGYTTPGTTTPVGATIYIGGTVQMNGTASLCGPPSVPSGSTCSGSWDPTQGALFLVAVNTNGAANPLAIGWTANGGAYYDVAVYVEGQYKSNGNSGVTGPIITDSAAIAGNGSTTDVANPPPTAPGAETTSAGSTTWGVIPASWQQLQG